MPSPSLHFRPGAPRDRTGAVEVWQAANQARGLPPGLLRVERVRQKLEKPDALVVVGLLHEQIVAMALAEPARAGDGLGELVTGTAHVSMVFVHPDHQSRGIGTALLETLHVLAAERDFPRTSLWTRATNLPAQRLYAKTGYLPSVRRSTLPTGEVILHLHR